MDSPTAVDTVRPLAANADDLFICFAKADEKCRGAVGRMDSYKASRALVLAYEGARGVAKDNENWLVERLNGTGEVRAVHTIPGNPLYMVRRLRTEILEVKNGRPTSITIDVTSFSKNELLLTLRLLDIQKLLPKTRILYTEPEDYIVTEVVDWTPPGIRDVSVIPTFKGKFDSQRGLALVLLLGYEGERALSTWENIMPNATYVVLPRPSYRPDWEGRVERHNAALLAGLDPDENIRYAHSQEPRDVYDMIGKIVSDHGEDANWYVSHFGTKLQLIGLYHYISRHPGIFSIIDSRPYGESVEYRSTGIGRTWHVPGPPVLQTE